MPKAIANYLRLSQEDMDLRKNAAKDESNSILSQRRITEQYISSHPDLAELPRVEFCDDGYSGTNFERPGFEGLLELVRSGKVGTIIVKDLSRFGRNYLEVGDYLEHIFPYLGVRIISVNDHYDSNDYSGSTGGIDIAFRNLINDYYSRDLSKKVKAGMRVHQNQAKYINCVPYGYQRSPSQKHQMVIDPEAAPVVRQIFLDMIAGKSTVQIARELNDRGVPPPSVYKKVRRSAKYPDQCQWTHSRIYDIVKNIKYTGTMVNHKVESRHLRDKSGRKTDSDEWIVRENAHEAIVTPEIFQAANRAQYRITYKGRTLSDSATRIFYCGHCGRKLRKTYGNDTYYSCSAACYHSESPCKAVKWSKTQLNKVLKASLKGQLMLMQKPVSSGNQIEEQIKSLNQQRLLLHAQEDHLDSERVQGYIRFREGSLSMEEYTDQKNRLARDAEELREKILQVEHEIQNLRAKQKDSDKTPSKAAEELLLDEEALQGYLYRVIERVTIWDDKHMEIRWNFDDLLSIYG